MFKIIIDGQLVLYQILQWLFVISHSYNNLKKVLSAHFTNEKTEVEN